MKIIVDKLPNTCKDCLYFKNSKCFLTEETWNEEPYTRLDNCPLIDLENNIKINFKEVDRYGFWERRYEMYLGSELISKWKEDIHGRHSSWND